jgi:DNA-binding MltR family transcriptional regulator
MLDKKLNNINLLKYFENVDNLWAFHNQFNFENNDRAIVIVGLSYIDDLLLKCLENFFPDKSKTVEKLLSHRGVLGNFNSKVELLYCLGFIDKIVKSDLDTLGEIRNKFAHKLKISFEDEEIINKCNSFKWHEIAMMRKAPKEATAIDIFKVEVNTMVSHLSGIVSICASDKRILKEAHGK